MNAPPSARPLVSVIGSGTRDHPESSPLGRGLAEAGVDLVTGGGGGVMAGVSRAFFDVPDRRGRVVGILPSRPDAPGEAPAGYPNPWVEIPIRTHLPGRGAGGAGPDSRNHLVVLTGHLVVALPGGPGTASELALATGYGRPVVLLGWSGPDPGPETIPPGPGVPLRRFDRAGDLLSRLGSLLPGG